LAGLRLCHQGVGQGGVPRACRDSRRTRRLRGAVVPRVVGGVAQQSLSDADRLRGFRARGTGHLLDERGGISMPELLRQPIVPGGSGRSCGPDTGSDDPHPFGAAHQGVCALQQVQYQLIAELAHDGGKLVCAHLGAEQFGQSADLLLEFRRDRHTSMMPRACDIRRCPRAERTISGHDAETPSPAVYRTSAVRRGANLVSKSRSLGVQTSSQSLSCSCPAAASRAIPRRCAVARSASHQTLRSRNPAVSGWKSAMTSTIITDPEGTGSGAPSRRALQSYRRKVPAAPSRNGFSTSVTSRVRSMPSQSVERRCTRVASRKSSPRRRTEPGIRATSSRASVLLPDPAYPDMPTTIG